MRQLGGGHNSTILPQFQSGGRPARARSTEDLCDILRPAARNNKLVLLWGVLALWWFLALLRLLEVLRYQLKADPIIAFAVARRAWIYSTTNR